MKLGTAEENQDQEGQSVETTDQKASVKRRKESVVAACDIERQPQDQQYSEPEVTGIVDPMTRRFAHENTIQQNDDIKSFKISKGDCGQIAGRIMGYGTEWSPYGKQIRQRDNRGHPRPANPIRHAVVQGQPREGRAGRHDQALVEEDPLDANSNEI